VPRTPDRVPGPAEEEKLILQDEGLSADNPGEVVFTGGAFSMRDAVGVFDPRSGGGGITEAQHENLDTLVHWLSEDNYQEVVRSGGKVTSVINWTDSGKTTKIRELVITRSSGKVSQMDFIQYDGSGVEKVRMTGVITRVSGKIDHVVWTETVA